MVHKLFNPSIHIIQSKSSQIKNSLITRTYKFIVYIRAKSSKVFTYKQDKLLFLLI